jgi:hypothetical protein
MTIRERETLQAFIDKPHAVGTLYEIVAVLASVALKHEQIRIAQAAPGSVAVSKCARCQADLYPGDDFSTLENGASVCWPQSPVLRSPGKPCFRDRGKCRTLLDNDGFHTSECVERLASADTHPKDGDAQQAPLVSGAVPEGQTPKGQHHGQ